MPDSVSGLPFFLEGNTGSSAAAFPRNRCDCFHTDSGNRMDRVLPPLPKTVTCPLSPDACRSFQSKPVVGCRETRRCRLDERCDGGGNCIAVSVRGCERVDVFLQRGEHVTFPARNPPRE